MNRLDDDTEHVIALAWHQGILRQPNLNTFQLFAAQYQMRRLRDRFVEDVDNILEKTTYFLHQQRHQELFPEKYHLPGQVEPLTMAGRPVEEVVEDLDVYDAYFADLEKKRFVTGGEVLAASGDERWPWQ